MEDEDIHTRFEDIEDMMDHTYDKLDDAIYHYCLCLKVSLPGAEEKYIKAFLMTYLESQFDDIYERLVPCIKKNGNDNIIYGSLKKDKY